MPDLMPIADIGIVTTPLMSVKNPELLEHTTAILEHSNDVKMHMFAIAKHLMIIKDKSLWIEDGFDGIADYAQKVLGYKPVTTSNLISVARNYVKATDNGSYESIIKHDDGNDYTVNQLLEVKSLGEKTVVEMDKNGEIDPSMTVREIRSVVQRKKGKDPDAPKKTRKRRNKVAEVQATAKSPDNIDMCILRVIESLQVIMDDESFSKNIDFIKHGIAVLNILSDINIEGV